MMEPDKSDRFPVRKSPRMRNFDYSSPNYYFVTICTNDKVCHFGSPTMLSPYGVIARTCLLDICEHFPGISLDKWVVMPNHIHAIIILKDDQIKLSTVIGQYKSAVTKMIHTVEPGLRLWQTSFHDHVIRTQADYERIWAYIDANPARWMDDCFYIPQDL